MVTLHPPFRAQSMEGLYKKVIKGNYPKISDNYSSDLSELIKILLKVNAEERPSCAQILKHPIVKKRLDYFQAQNGIADYDDNMDENELLKTIRIPKNILFLTDKLPGANYINDGKKNKKEMVKMDQPILVPAGETLHIRVLPWYDSNGQPQKGKYLQLGDLQITGKRLK